MKSPPGQNHRGCPAPCWTSLPGRALLPLRAFLGITFCYAGWQKFTDPQFFDTTARGYLGHQLAVDAQHSPLGGLLTGLAVPHASFFGGLIAFGELLVGLATLLGLLSRLSAGVGVGMNVLFWLTVTWGVQPYFLDADPIYAMAWLALFIAGATDYSLDRWLARARQRDRAALLRASRPPQPGQAGARPTSDQATDGPGGTAEVKRRALLRLLLAGGAVVATSAFIAVFARVVESGGRRADSAGEGGSAIGNTSQIPLNGALSFTLRDGDPGVVVRLSANQFVAYDATCTHAGCTVQYDQSSRELLCPCHGARFDPASNGAAVSGPANQPLATVQLHIDSSGAIYVDT